MTDNASSPQSLQTVLFRGLKRRCPNCGKGALYRAFLKPVDQCNHCDEQLGHIRSDDIPTYFTVLLVGHIVVTLAMITDQMFNPSTFVMLSILLPTAIILMLLFLPHIKGVTISLLWRLRLSDSDK
jgi:uncharacterized protein (DUF983 family)